MSPHELLQLLHILLLILHPYFPFTPLLYIPFLHPASTPDLISPSSFFFFSSTTNLTSPVLRLGHIQRLTGRLGDIGAPVERERSGVEAGYRGLVLVPTDAGVVQKGRDAHVVDAAVQWYVCYYE